MNETNYGEREFCPICKGKCMQEACAMWYENEMYNGEHDEVKGWCSLHPCVAGQLFAESMNDFCNILLDTTNAFENLEGINSSLDEINRLGVGYVG